MSARRGRVSVALAARGAVRGLISPWFAAATGVMIAASLWIYYPQAQFLQASTLGVMHCTPEMCVAGHGGAVKPSLTTSGRQPIARRRARPHRVQAARPDRRRRREGTRRVAVDYSVFSDWSGGVVLRITLTGRVSPNWTLSLTLPGDKITYVYGAGWQQTGPGSAIARGQPGRDGGGAGWQQEQNTARFVVVAAGKSTVPTGCVLDGAACTFRAQTGTFGH